MSKNEKDGSTVKLAIVSGIFTIIAAIIAGLFNFFGGNAASNVSLTQAVGTSSPLTATANCASLTAEQIDLLRNTKKASDAVQQAEKFAGYHHESIKAGGKIPAEVIFSADLTKDWTDFPVSEIKSQNGVGLFLTLDTFTVPNAGTYWCIQQ